MPRPSLHERLHEEIVACRACPRLTLWCEKIAREKRRMYKDWSYWGRPVPGFGDPSARIVIVGLAPAAHGANRTGRMFTGDRSGDFLFAALHRAALASQAESSSRDDGLTLSDVFIVATLRCAPPDNQPLPDEILRCQSFLDREIALLRRRRVLLALGAIAWEASLRHLERQGHPIPRPRPKFAHGAMVTVPGERAPLLLGSFHVSQQNTQTGRLTPEMFDGILAKAKNLAEIS